MVCSRSGSLVCQPHSNRRFQSGCTHARAVSSCGLHSQVSAQSRCWHESAYTVGVSCKQQPAWLPACAAAVHGIPHNQHSPLPLTDAAVTLKLVCANRPAVRIFDTTLRDGEQSPGATLTSKEKLDIAKQLAKLGVDIIEAGFPIASPDDFEAVRAIAMEVGNDVQVRAMRRLPCRSLQMIRARACSSVGAQQLCSLQDVPGAAAVCLHDAAGASSSARLRRIPNCTVCQAAVSPSLGYK
jgi:hypothetical protein